MRKTPTRILGAVAAVLAAGLVGYALRSPRQSIGALAARNTPAEVKTLVIRKTIHIVRHPKASAGRGPGPRGRAYVVGAGGTVAGAAGGGVRTGASRSHVTGPAASGTVPVTTRTSSHGTTSAPATAPASAPVTTRTSSHGSTGASSGSKPVTTRTSSHGTGSSSGPVTTRTSGSGDGGDDGGGHDN